MSKKYTRKQDLEKQSIELQMKVDELMSEYYSLEVKIMKKKLIELENELLSLEHAFIFS
mgnify:CR=1 FL=1